MFINEINNNQICFSFFLEKHNTQYLTIIYVIFYIHFLIVRLSVLKLLSMRLWGGGAVEKFKLIKFTL